LTYPRKITISKCILVFCSVIFSLLFIDLCFRIYLGVLANQVTNKCPNFDQKHFGFSRAFSLDYGFYMPGDVVNHCGLEWDYTYHIDQNGFRFHNGISQNILAIGDSFTFGFGVEDDQAFPALLHAYNAGMWGNPFDVQYAAFKRDVAGVKPQIVTWGIYPSHIVTMMPHEWSTRCPGDAQYPNTIFTQIYTFLLSNTGIGKYVMKNQHILRFEATSDGILKYMDCYSTKEVLLYDKNLANNKYTCDPEVNKTFQPDRDAVYNKIEQYFTDAKKLAETNNIKVYFLVIPSRMDLRLKDGSYKVSYPGSDLDPDLPLNTLTEIITKAGFDKGDIIDLADYFMKSGDWKKYYFKQDAHWTALGHKFVAKIIADKIMQDGSLKAIK
jgi:hypothetical protein